MKSPSLYQATAGAGLPVAVHVKTTCDERFVNEGRFDLYHGKKGQGFSFSISRRITCPDARTSTLAGATVFQRRWDQRGEITNDSGEKKIRRRSKTENHELFRKKKKY